MRIFKCEPDCNVYQSLVILHEDEYDIFDRFAGTPLSASWSPVPVTVRRPEEELEEKPPGDFPSLMPSIAPAFSLRAVEGLRDILEANGEILPLLCDEGDYFAYNTTTLSNALDEERSRIKRFEDGDIMVIKEYQFHPDRLGAAAIFKLTQEPRSGVFVTEEFAQRVHELGLLGFEFILVWDSEAPSTSSEAHQTLDNGNSSQSGTETVNLQENQRPSPAERIRRRENWTPPVPLFSAPPVDEEIVRLIEESGLKQNDRLMALLRPSVGFRANRIDDHRIPVGHSKLGGEPDLAQGMAWPQMEGASLTFLAQINLAEVATLGLMGPLPSEGMLFFFYADPKKYVVGAPEEKDGFRVLFHPGPAGELTRTPIPPDVPKRGRYRACDLEGTIQWTLPPYESEQVDALGLDQEEQDLYFELAEEVWRHVRGYDHCFAGYPNQMQGSIMGECQHASTGMEREHPAFSDEALGWTLLMQVNTEKPAGMVWGDDGILYFCIREDDLKQLAFDKVWMIMQCG